MCNIVVHDPAPFEYLTTINGEHRSMLPSGFIHMQCHIVYVNVNGMGAIYYEMM